MRIVFPRDGGHVDSQGARAPQPRRCPRRPSIRSRQLCPSLDVSPFRSSLNTDRPAVNPAVPSAIASKSVRPRGTGTTQSRRHSHVARVATIVRDAKVVAGDQDRVAFSNRESRLDATTPATSMPPMSGNRRRILPAAGRGQRVLVVHARVRRVDDDLSGAQFIERRIDDRSVNPAVVVDDAKGAERWHRCDCNQPSGSRRYDSLLPREVR